MAEARRRAGDVLKSQTIGKSGYVYCLNSQGVLVLHPVPDAEGADISRFPLCPETDANA